MSCATAGSNASVQHPATLPHLTGPGSVRVQKDVSTITSQPAVFNLDSSPTLSSGEPVFISKSGFLIEASINGNQSEIYKRMRPSANWTYVGSIPGVAVQLDFDTLDSGFALVGSSLFSANSLYSTSDGGRQWSLISTGNYVQMHFFDSRDGLAVTNPPVGLGLEPGILITVDGGHRWIRASGSALPQIGLIQSPYASFSFVSNEVGWLALGGQPGAGSQEKWLLKTLDGGQSWSLVAVTPGFSSSTTTAAITPALTMGGYLAQVRFVSYLVGYMALEEGPPGAVLKTLDGGIHWKQQQVLPVNNFRSTNIAQIAPNTLYGGIAVTDFGSIWNQAKPGEAWKEVYPPYRAVSVSYGSGNLDVITEQGRVFAFGSDLSFAPKFLGNLGFKTEAINAVSNGVIVITSNPIDTWKSGKAWTKIPIPTGWQLNGGLFLSKSVGLVAQRLLNSALEATINGGHSWTLVPLPFVPFSLDPLSATDWWVIGEVSGPLEPNPYKKNVRVSTYSLYHTANAGRSWSEYETNWGSGTGLFGVKFYSSAVGYVWTQNAIFVTTNGGITFVSHQLPENQVIPNPSSLAVGSAGRAWIVSDSYPVFETKDFGANWSAVG